MLKLVMALVLAMVSVQCAAACAPVTTAQPPCHHHKQAPSCSHELIPATIVPSIAIAMSLPSEAVTGVFLNVTSIGALNVQTPSSPDPPIPLKTILRI